MNTNERAGAAMREECMILTTLASSLQLNDSDLKETVLQAIESVVESVAQHHNAQLKQVFKEWLEDE